MVLDVTPAAYSKKEMVLETLHHTSSKPADIDEDGRSTVAVVGVNLPEVGLALFACRHHKILVGHHREHSLPENRLHPCLSRELVEKSAEDDLESFRDGLLVNHILCRQIRVGDSKVVEHPSVHIHGRQGQVDRLVLGENPREIA